MGSAPVALDAWEQFYKNISGVGFSAFIILFGSCMSGEYSKGTLVLLVTRGLPRRAVISLLGTAEPLVKFNPFLLTSKNVDLISGAASVSELFAPATISAAMTAAGLWAAIIFFDRKQL